MDKVEFLLLSCVLFFMFGFSYHLCETSFFFILDRLPMYSHINISSAIKVNVRR